MNEGASLDAREFSVLVDLSLDAPGGARTYVGGFVEGLIAADPSAVRGVVVLLAQTWATTHAGIVATLRSSGVVVDVVDVPMPGSWRARLGRRRLLNDAVRRHGCEAVFVPRDAAPATCVPNVTLARNRYAWESHGTSRAVGGGLAAVALRVATRRSARRTAALLAVSRAFADDVNRVATVAGVVHHGCSLREHPRPTSVAESSLTVAMFANIAPSKRFEDVIDAVGAATGLTPGLELRLYGAELDAAYSQALRRRSVEVLGRDVLCGPVAGSDLVEAYLHADIVAVGASFETFCFPLIEGMRSGAVVVAPDCALVRELCGECAVTYREGDVASLEQAICQAVLDRDSLSAAGIQRARPFTWANTVEQSIRWVRSVAS